MRFFMKLNAISALYGFLFFLFTTVLANPSRIAELTGIPLNALAIGFFIVLLLGAAAFAFMISLLTKRWMKGSRVTLWSTILWFPYWLFFALSFSFFFPNPNPYDEDNYGAAFVIFGLLLAYPFFLGLSTLFGIIDRNTTKI